MKNLTSNLHQDYSYRLTFAPLGKERMEMMKRLLISVFILLALAGCGSNPPAYPTLDRCLGLHTMSLPECAPPTSLPATMPVSLPATILVSTNRSVSILVDDFSPQPYQGESVYFFNRLEGDRGAINNSIMDWGNGQVKTTISQGNSWGGVWMSLNHPIREELPINFSALLPAQILPAYQSQITGMTVGIVSGTPGRTFKLELKNGNELSWREEIILEGGAQVLSFDLPTLGNINQLVWVLDHANPGDFVVLDSISFIATTQVTDTATAAFVWSYGMLLNNWNPETGLVRDKAKDASGEFDAIQATGSLAVATAIAELLGVVSHSDAIQIVGKIEDALLIDLPRSHGLWPHWVKTSSSGEISIVENTEWSSVDTVIAAVGLLKAQSGLGMDTLGTEQMLQEIEWDNLVTDKGISHGYTYSGDLIPYTWDAFGGESWLVELAYAGVTGQVAPLAYASPPTANGSGFIDELPWLFIPPPPDHDYWGIDWTSYRLTAVDNQISYYPTYDSTSCFSQLGLFGLSAGEVPAPSMVAQNNIYQAYGVGGTFAPANDGSALGAPVIAPHYSAMIASLRPEEAIKMWDWLIANGHFSPLNNVESLMFPEDGNCDPKTIVWNQLKGSWNLSLQTLGWGRYLVEQGGQTSYLWEATTTNPLLQKGYDLLASSQLSIPASTPTLTLTPTSGLWSYERECEYPDDVTVGVMIERSNALGLKVHGQFGTVPAWPAQPGYVQYNNINIPQTDNLYLKLRYSKYSPSFTPIQIYLDDEPTPRATFTPTDQGDWNILIWTEPIPLGSVAGGIHSIKFYTDGQQYGVADLDKFVLTAESTSALPVPQITPIASNDLLVWYDFESDFLTSGFVSDRSGNGYDAQINGTVNVTEGVSGGQSIYFSGNGHILTQSNPVAGRNTVSFSLWFKTDHPENNYKLASAAWWNGGPGSGWILATHIPEFWSDDTQSLYLPSIVNNENYFSAGKWIHEVITYDSDRIREYTNGQLVNDWQTSGAAIGEGQAMAVGAWPLFGFNFQGSIDEFQVFANSLTDQEVQALYDQGR